MEPLRANDASSLEEQAPLLSCTAHVLGVVAGVAGVNGNRGGMKEVERPLVAALLRPNEGLGRLWWVRVWGPADYGMLWAC